MTVVYVTEELQGTWDELKETRNRTVDDSGEFPPAPGARGVRPPDVATFHSAWSASAPVGLDVIISTGARP